MVELIQSLWVWVTATYPGKIAASVFVSMLPIVELRGGIPIAVGLGLEPRVAIPVCVLGNIIPILPVLLVIRQLFRWMRSFSPWTARLVGMLERRVNKHRDVLDKYAWMGLAVLTAIPLPGTGAWTAAMLAGLAGVRFRQAVPAISLGVACAAAIMSVLSYGVAAIL